MLARLHRIKGSIDMAYDYIQRAKVVFRTLSQNMLPPPYDLEHQKNLGNEIFNYYCVFYKRISVYNDYALSHAGKGDYIEAIALLTQVIQSEEELGDK